MLIQLIEGVYRLLWGDLLTLHLGSVTLSLSFMVILHRNVLEKCNKTFWINYTP